MGGGPVVEWVITAGRAIPFPRYLSLCPRHATQPPHIPAPPTSEPDGSLLALLSLCPPIGTNGS